MENNNAIKRFISFFKKIIKKWFTKKRKTTDGMGNNIMKQVVFSTDDDTSTPVSEAFVFTEGYMSATNACGSSSYILTLYAEYGTLLTFGTIMYTDPELTTLFSGGSLWYHNPLSGGWSYQIESGGVNEGVIQDAQAC
jgi:hypothetical protein